MSDHLAVDARALAAAVSLREDLGTDSLDLLELALLLEREFGVAVSDGAVEEMRSYGDVVDGVARLVFARSLSESRILASTQPPHVHARLRSPGTASGGGCDWGGVLTGYMVETLAEAAHRAGPGARLEILVAAEAPAATLATVREQFARTRARLIDVIVARVTESGSPWPAPSELATG